MKALLLTIVFVASLSHSIAQLSGGPNPDWIQYEGSKIESIQKSHTNLAKITIVFVGKETRKLNGKIVSTFLLPTVEEIRDIANKEGYSNIINYSTQHARLTDEYCQATGQFKEVWRRYQIDVYVYVQKDDEISLVKTEKHQPNYLQADFSMKGPPVKDLSSLSEKITKIIKELYPLDNYFIKNPDFDLKVDVKNMSVSAILQTEK